MNRATVERRVALWVVTVLFVVPLAATAAVAFMSDRQVLTRSLWPSPFEWTNIGRALRTQPIARELVTTSLVAGLTTAGILVSSVPAAYALARLRWRGRTIALGLVVGAFLMPSQIVSVPIYWGFAKLHLVGGLAPLIVPAWLGDALSIFLLRQFFLSVPTSMLESARLEGCSEWAVLRRVVLPMTRPGIISVVLINVVATWGDFYTQYLYVGDRPQDWTVSIGLAQFRSAHSVEWNLTMAAALVVIAPVVVVLLLSQRRLTDAVASQTAAG